MLEALRGLGYSTATALADIIDNSIAACAERIDLTFNWNGLKSYITVADNGTGMDEIELESAMRLGQLSPLNERRSSDLGRFGMGLKTASFSQARRLTVLSKKRHGATGGLCWDLDFIAAGAGDEWHLLEVSQEDAEPFSRQLGQMQSGTLVIWQALDRVVSAGFAEQDFLDLIDQVQGHLAMTYHRYLEGHGPRLQITINGRLVAPWDPLLAQHPATWSSPVERLATQSGLIEVQCHVLPHKDRLDRAQYELAAGQEGWTAHQGFYVYRNQRLLLAGSWLGLGQGRAWTKEEAHRLARIRLDIPNTADTDWKIDIRKATARPPVSVRARLVLLAEDTRRRARLVFAHRARAVPAGAKSIASMWRAEHVSGGVRYRIDRTHPAIQSVLEQSGHPDPQLDAMLCLIEETVPVQRIWLDTADGQETPRTGFEGEPPERLRAVLGVVYRNLVLSRGLTSQAARELLLRMEPFDAYPKLVAALSEEP